MALQNIGVGNRDDAFYRYKMPKLVTKVEGRGNGIKTNLVNMVDVAKALSRPPAYTTKYFGCELGAQSRFDEKTGTAIVNGAHETVKLSALLENFIKKYVQCYGCGNPETEIVISKNQLISLKCAACGFVSDVDMRDKLTTFILKNPPEQKKKEKKGMRRAERERLKEGEVLDENIKKGKKETKSKRSHNENVRVSRKKVVECDVEEHSPASSQKEDTEEDEAEEEVQWQTDTSASAAQQRMKEQLTAATSELIMLNNADNEKEMHKAEKKEAPRKSSMMDESVTESLDIYEGLVEEFRKCLEKGLNDKQLVQRLHSVQPQSSDQEVMNAYFEALFQGAAKGLAKDIKRKRLFLSQAVKDCHDQILLLRAVEAYCASGPLELQKEISLVLKMLYELDIVEEDAVMTWYDAASEGIKVKRFAKPFVEWLKTAESEEESS